MSTGTILYFHYVEGIGDTLTKDGLPMPLSAFVQKLATDQLFCDYYDQLFQFLRTVGEGQADSAVSKIIECLERIQQFLQITSRCPTSYR
jgi:hypothetical protein